MPSSPTLTAAPAGPPVRPPAGGVRRRAVDGLAVLLSLALAVWVTSGLWIDPGNRLVTVNSSDQVLFEWLLAYGAHAVENGRDPLFTQLLNVPHGVNLAVNTSITVYAVAFAPLTYLIGPAPTFVIILTLNLTGTALAWYWLLSRHLVTTPAAALLGGLFIGFAPGMVSHANAHLNWTAGWLVPLLVWRVVRLRDRGRWLRNGLVLGLLVAVAFSIAAEGLFFTALACGVFLAGWAAHPARRAAARADLPTFVRGLGVTAVVAAALLAYPLWLHFLGPQRFDGTGFDQVIHAEDIGAYLAYPNRSLAGLVGLDGDLAPNPTEENSFFGLVLPALAIACLVLLWRRADAGHRATLTGYGLLIGVFTVLSFGPKAKVFGTFTDVPLPFALLDGLPVVNSALPARLALVVAPVVGLLLAGAADELLRHPPRSRPTTVAWVAGYLAALLPLVPVPLATTARDPVPEFITSGAWRDYVPPDGGVLVPVPIPLDLTPDGQRWQAYALTRRQGEFAVPSGFFLGPGGPDGRGRIGPVPRPTDALLNEVARTSVVPAIGAAEREAARVDLRHWNASAVVLADRAHGAKFPVRSDALLRATSELLGPPERVLDVWVWQAPGRWR